MGRVYAARQLHIHRSSSASSSASSRGRPPPLLDGATFPPGALTASDTVRNGASRRRARQRPKHTHTRLRVKRESGLKKKHGSRQPRTVNPFGVDVNGFGESVDAHRVLGPAVVAHDAAHRVLQVHLARARLHTNDGEERRHRRGMRDVVCLGDEHMDESKAHG